MLSPSCLSRVYTAQQFGIRTWDLWDNLLLQVLADDIVENSSVLEVIQFCFGIKAKCGLEGARLSSFDMNCNLKRYSDIIIELYSQGSNYCTRVMFT